MTDKMTYEAAGVNYDVMDKFKRAAQEAAATTWKNVERLGYRVDKTTCGESAMVVKPKRTVPYLAPVHEGLGTKNLVADAMYKITGKSYYDQIAQDTVAMIVNDVITSGALPLTLAMHLAVGDSDWFRDEQRYTDLIEGWKKATDLARAAWVGGETPTLRDIVNPGTAEISGSSVGVPLFTKMFESRHIRDKDQIILVSSSGIHANGLTLARKIAGKLPKGYETFLPHGRTYGEALLEPTPIYAPLIEACLFHEVNIHYAVNITGHGWRKLMRAPQPYTYVIDELPSRPRIFDFLMKQGPMDEKEAFATLNMGAGFAIYASEEDTQKLFLAISKENVRWKGLHVMVAGHIEKSKEKKVVIRPKNLEFTGETLQIR